MQTHILVPLTETARLYRGPQGGNIHLTTESTVLGRNVGATGPAAVSLPTAVGWGKVSGKHCRIFCNSEGFWFVEDLSRNGTFLNNEKVIKNTPKQLTVGDKLLLSPAIPQKPNLNVEFEFKKLAPETPAKESPLTEKRKSRDEISPAASIKRAKSQEPGQSKQLMDTIRDLQQQNREQLARFEKESEERSQRIKELEGTIATKNAALSASETALEEAEKKLVKQEDAMKAAAGAAEAERAQLLQRLQKAEDQLGTTQDTRMKQINSLKASNAKLSADFRDVQQQVSSVKEELRLSEEAKLDLEGELHDAKAAAVAATEALESRLRAAERAAADAAAAVQSAEQRTLAGQAKVEAEVKARQAAEAVIATLKADVDSAKQVKHRAEERESNLRGQLRLKDGALACLRDACVSLAADDARNEEALAKAEEAERMQADARAVMAETARRRQETRAYMELQLNITSGSASEGRAPTAQTATSNPEAADETLTTLAEGNQSEAQDPQQDTQIMFEPETSLPLLPQAAASSQQQAVSSARAATQAVGTKQGSQRSSQRLAAKQSSSLPDGIQDNSEAQPNGHLMTSQASQPQPFLKIAPPMQKATLQREANSQGNGAIKESMPADRMDIDFEANGANAASQQREAGEASDRTSASVSHNGDVDDAVEVAQEPATPPDASLIDPNANPEGVTPISKKSRLAQVRASGISTISDSDQDA